MAFDIMFVFSLLVLLPVGLLVANPVVLPTQSPDGSELFRFSEGYAYPESPKNNEALSDSPFEGGIRHGTIQLGLKFLQKGAKILGSAVSKTSFADSEVAFTAISEVIDLALDESTADLKSEMMKAFGDLQQTVGNIVEGMREEHGWNEYRKYREFADDWSHHLEQSLEDRANYQKVLNRVCGKKTVETMFHRFAQALKAEAGKYAFQYLAGNGYSEQSLMKIKYIIQQDAEHTLWGVLACNKVNYGNDKLNYKKDAKAIEQFLETLDVLVDQNALTAIKETIKRDQRFRISDKTPESPERSLIEFNKTFTSLYMNDRFAYTLTRIPKKNKHVLAEYSKVLDTDRYFEVNTENEFAVRVFKTNLTSEVTMRRRKHFQARKQNAVKEITEYLHKEGKKSDLEKIAQMVKGNELYPFMAIALVASDPNHMGIIARFRDDVIEISVDCRKFFIKDHNGKCYLKLVVAF